MSVFSRERLDLERDLRRALPLKQFEVRYQPKIAIASGRMNSVEPLLRWRHPTRGLVGPNDFIPLAEESGLMFGIGEWVLRKSCRQARPPHQVFAQSADSRAHAWDRVQTRYAPEQRRRWLDAR
jgi:EAL domain-containing protein (putative c-di-GMP-specific phosphodiesterase class I)